MKIKKISYILIFTSFMMISFVSCGIFGGNKSCGMEGEAEVKIGKETTKYCSITSQFRESSVTFDETENVLLINLLGYDFEEDTTEEEKKQASAFGLRERTSLEKSGFMVKDSEGEDIISEELLKKITGNRQIMIQIPYDGKGTYKSESLFVMMYKDDELVYRFTPSNKTDKMTFSLKRFDMSDLSEEEINKTVFRVASDEEKKRVKKVKISAKLTGSITFGEEKEKANINSKINFSTVIEIPQSLLSDDEENEDKSKSK